MAAASSGASSAAPTATSAELPRIHVDEAPITLPISVRLRESLDSCSKVIEAGDYAASDVAVAGVAALLESIIDSPPSDGEDAIPVDRAAEEALFVIHSYLLSSDLDQILVDALSFVVPKVVVKFAVVSDRCWEMAESIIDCFVSSCSPRDMLSIVCEALDVHREVPKAPIYLILLLSGLAKDICDEASNLADDEMGYTFLVLLRIQRHHTEQVKVALPVILGVLSAISSDSDEEDEDFLEKLFGVAVSIGISMQEICRKLVGSRKEELLGVLGLYALQNLALISRSRLARNVSHCRSLVIQFSGVIPFCGLSYLGLLTGSDLDTITQKISEEDVDDFMACFSLKMHGGALAVVWGHIIEDVAKAADEQLVTVLAVVRDDRIRRWQAVNTLRYILASTDYPWEIKYHSIDFLLSMMVGDNSKECGLASTEWLSFMPTLFAALQAIQRIIIGTSTTSARKKAFVAFKKVLSDIPASERIEMLKALITNSNFPSMTAILIDLVKENVLMENHQQSLSLDETKQVPNGKATSPFWSSDVLNFVEMVLRPPKGGPPSLPEDSESVLSALNLYRFILIAESTGKTNRTGVLSESTLRKAYEEWLLPLRTLVSGMQAETSKDDSEIADNIVAALNPVQFVLHRCIEIVEDLRLNSS